MMWILFARAPTPDAQVWPGRRMLALVDAIVWPAAWTTWLLGLPVPLGLAGQFALAWCGVAALRRAIQAVGENHRYRFTTWRWGRGVLLALALGYALKLAALVSG